MNIRRRAKHYTERWICYLKRRFRLIKKLQSWIKTYQQHALIWLLFIIYEVVYLFVVNGVTGHPLNYATHYIIIIFLFYFHANIGLPWATQIKTRNYWKIPLLIVEEIFVYLLVAFLDDTLLTKLHYLSVDDWAVNTTFVLRNSYRALYFIGFSTGYYYIFNYIKERKKSEELEKQKLNELIQRQKAERELARSEIAFLKAQINPHFLFNTLDYIYHHIAEITPVAAEAIITLSEMMRFAIDADKMGEEISLGEELEQVNNLIFLSRLRKDDAPDFQLFCGETVEHIRLIPLVLLTLTENIFKHGNLLKGQSASMSIYVSDEMLHIDTDNQSNRVPQKTGHGSGLSNIEKRLKYAYGEDVNFNAELNPEGRFKVLIKIPVKQLKYASEGITASLNIDKAQPHAAFEPPKKVG